MNPQTYLHKTVWPTFPPSSITEVMQSERPRLANDPNPRASSYAFPLDLIQPLFHPSPNVIVSGRHPQPLYSAPPAAPPPSAASSVYCISAPLNQSVPLVSEIVFTPSITTLVRSPSLPFLYLTLIITTFFVCLSFHFLPFHLLRRLSLPPSLPALPSFPTKPQPMYT